MLVGNQTLPTQERVFLKKLKALDLRPIAYQLMHLDSGLGWTQAQTTRAISRYRMFLVTLHRLPQLADTA